MGEYDFAEGYTGIDCEGRGVKGRTKDAQVFPARWTSQAAQLGPSLSLQDTHASSGRTPPPLNVVIACARVRVRACVREW